MNNGEGMTEEQKNYLQGFIAGTDLARNTRGLPTFPATLARNGRAPAPVPGPAAAPGATHVEGPDALQRRAQDRALAEGKALTPEDQAKRLKHPLDRWDEFVERADAGRFPKGIDVAMAKYFGMFYVAPAQDSYMCRLRIPGGILGSWQLRGVAEVAERYAGGYSHVTTRANLQLREIGAEDPVNVLARLQDYGLVTRGSGTDNIRNVTATPTAGIDAQELIDTRPLAREMHDYILNHREMYGLPRKFNIAFDGGGTIAALEDTNDIGFAAVRVGEGAGAEAEVPAGVYFRLALGGITGHRDFARDAGVLLTPRQCVPVAAALVRVFIEHGDRTDRKRARMKYVLDRWGLEKYLEEAEKALPEKLRRFPLDRCEPRPQPVRGAHIGFHPQRQPGLSYVGVVLPVGRMTVEQMRGLAAIAERHGSGTIRLTVWQNLLISDIPDDRTDAVREEIEALGLGCSATQVRAGLVACTGNFGCKFASSDTKRHGLQIADHLDARLALDVPLNIHLTGCPNSCAQHYIGDIGLLGTRVEAGDDMVEGYHIYVGGAHGNDPEIGRELYTDVKADDAPELLERMLRGYLSARRGEDESFLEFVRRHPTDQLRDLIETRNDDGSRRP